MQKSGGGAENPAPTGIGEFQNLPGRGLLEMSNEYVEFKDTLMSLLHLTTFPFRAKLLHSEKEIPDLAERPMRDWGHRISLCQAFGLARRDGLSVAMMKEDNWCFEPVLGLGIEPLGYLSGRDQPFSTNSEKP